MSPRADKPRVVTFVKTGLVGLDVFGVVHYLRDITIIDETPCTAIILVKPVSWRGITCLECLGMPNLFLWP